MTTPLAEKLRQRIRLAGPISVADYMAACLGDPEHGYYLHRDPLGRGGDFITAPEISQMFGELIGLWCVATWEAMGSPPQVVLAEFGPGRGTLMADALRAARVRPAFTAAASIHLVETSPALRERQRRALAGHAVTWHADTTTLPPGPLLAIANEFFDALPIHQFVRSDNGWAERVIGLGPEGNLAFGLRPASLRQDAPVGAVLEICPAATALVETLAQRLAASGGAVLALDYGHVEPGFGDTLQAVRAHRFDDPLAHPGEADLTAHVDFTALAEAAQAGGAAVPKALTQGEFLQRLGLAERAAVLARGKDEATRRAIEAAVQRLAGDDGMGRLFKAFAVAEPGLPLPAFD